MKIEFRILGPLEVVVDGRIHHIGSRQQRVILCAVATQRNIALANDVLADLVWSGTPPPSVDVTLRGLVSRLRRTLGPAGDRLAATGGGYVLAASAEEVDADRFTQLVAAAREQVEAGRVESGIEQLRSALALWRGDAVAVELTGTERGEALAGRLEGVRATAVEALAAAELAAGRPDSAVELLERHVGAYSLREDAWKLLLTGLYRTGRQADALHAYRRIRDLLHDELGVEPGHGLRNLHRQILTQDPALDLAQPLGVAPADGLPSALTTLVGRSDELRTLAHELTTCRLLTLTGLGGVGKTRLAIALARELASHWDSIRLIELAAMDGGSLVVNHLARALGVPLPRSADSLCQLADGLADRRVLVVLDNCEHVLDELAPIVETLLSRCPEITVLATSREPLAVNGETVRPVLPLELPSPDASAPAELHQSPAVVLFCQRASATQGGFGLTADNAADIHAICRQLDGIPLALELAAARLRALSTHQVAARLGDRFALLTAGARTAQPRHQTLRATMDWSYQLLSAAEQAALRALTVFPADFDEVAAAAVAGRVAAGRSAEDVVFRLVDKSLVVVRRRAGETRYELLETVRLYAAALLDQFGEREVALRRHREHFCLQAVEWRSAMVVTATWSRLVAAEEENLRTAIASALADEDGPAARQLLCGLWPYWTVLGHLEYVTWFEQALALPGEDLRARAEVTVGLTLLTIWELGPSDRAEQLITMAIGLAEQSGDDGVLAWAHYFRGEVLFFRGDLAGARTEYSSALRLVPHPAEGVAFHHSLGWVCLAEGDTAAAQAEFEAAIAVGIDGDLHVAHAQAALALLLAGPGKERPVHLALNAVAAARRSMMPAITIMALVRAAQTLLLCGHDDEAAAHLREVFELFLRLGTRAYHTEALDTAACLAGHRGEHFLAVRYLGAADAIRKDRAENLGFTVLGSELASTTADAITALGEAIAHEARTHGGSETPARVIAEVRSWLAAIAGRRGRCPRGISGFDPKLSQ